MDQFKMHIAVNVIAKLDMEDIEDARQNYFDHSGFQPRSSHEFLMKMVPFKKRSMNSSPNGLAYSYRSSYEGAITNLNAQGSKAYDNGVLLESLCVGF